MGWLSNDSVHDGYLEAVLVDEISTSSSNAIGRVVLLRDDAGNYTGVDQQHTNDEVVGWQLRCDCSTPTRGRVSTWAGPSWQRVATAALENIEAGRIFVADDWDASTICDREDVDNAVRTRWLSDHVCPLETLDTIRTIRSEIATATAQLTEAVTYARAVGHTWETIGKAAGMTRQSAQERWASATTTTGRQSTPIEQTDGPTDEFWVAPRKPEAIAAMVEAARSNQPLSRADSTLASLAMDAETADQQGRGSRTHADPRQPTWEGPDERPST